MLGQRTNAPGLLIAIAVVAGGIVTATAVVGTGMAFWWQRASTAAPRATPSTGPLAEERCDRHGWCRPPPLRGAQPERGGDALAGVWAAAPDDVHAVSLTGMHHRFDGVRWSGRGSGEKTLRHVHGVAPDAVWLVGGRAALLWDGRELRRHAVPVRGQLYGVHALARDDAWAVSDSGDAAHFDGHSWTRVETPFRGWLLAVWGSRRDDVWAAGGGEDGTNATHALHWDGRRWTRVPLAKWTNIVALAGTASDDVWAAGSWGTLLHYDGARWTEVASPARRGLNGLWVGASDDAWAVGEDGMVLHFDGTAWSAAKPDWPELRGVSGTASGERFAVGIHGLVLHWRGAGFKLAPAPPPPKPAAPAMAAAPEEAPALVADSEAHLARARRLASEGAIDAASQAFIEASGKGQTVNLRPIVERAHLLMTRGAGSSVTFTLDELEGELEAGTRDGDPELEAQAWYNLALLHAQRGQPESERVALARSLLRRENARVRAKLGSRPACVAEVHTATGPELVMGWDGVCRSLGLCKPAEAVSAAEARARACLTCSFSAATPDQSHGCPGEGPWESAFGYHLYSFQKAWIARVGGGSILRAAGEHRGLAGGLSRERRIGVGAGRPLRGGENRMGSAHRGAGPPHPAGGGGWSLPRAADGEDDGGLRARHGQGARRGQRRGAPRRDGRVRRGARPAHAVRRPLRRLHCAARWHPAADAKVTLDRADHSEVRAIGGSPKARPEPEMRAHHELGPSRSTTCYRDSP